MARRYLSIYLAIALVLSTPFAFSQATSGSILGQITDSTGAVVVDATVTARNDATGLTQSSQSTDAGYTLYNLPPGTYTVTVSKSGFKKTSRDKVLLLIDQKLRVDFEVAPGSTSDSVTVTDEAPILQTQTVETGDVIQSRQILNLPLNGRQFLELTKLSPGVVNGIGGNSSNISVNGQREFGNSIMIDGVETTSNRNNDNSLSPSVDAVEEFKVVTSAYSAEYGRAAGAVIAIQTKSGTNQFHGSAYEFFRPNNTAARGFSFGETSEPSALKHHNFGVTLGGPIKKDKLFFFGSFEGFRERNRFHFLESVPPANMINYLPNGDVDLSGLIDPITGNQVPIFDPEFYESNFFAQQFPGNIIPANRVSPAGKAVLQSFFPAPNLPGIFNGWFSNFDARESFKQDTNNVDAKVDYNISQKDRISVVYHYGDLDEVLGDRFAGAIPVDRGGATDSSPINQSLDQSFSFNETHFFSDRWLNDFRFGYSRFRLDELDGLQGRDLADQFGVGNVNLPGFPSTSGFPQIFLGTGYITGGSTFEPLYFRDRNYQISDGVTARVGNHDIKFGVDYRRLSANPNFALFPTGFQFYGGAFSSLTADPNFAFFDPNAFFGNGGSDVADLLLGFPLSVNIGLQLTNPTTKSWESHFYFQDSWQVNSKFVLDYGVRYEYQNPYTEADNHASNFDPVTREILIAGVGGNTNALVTPDRNNFGPRVGFSYRFTPRSVLRAGYGVYFSPENDARSDVLTKDYPFALQSAYTNDIFGGVYPFPYQLDAGVSRVTTIPAIPSNGRIDATSIPDSKLQELFYVDPKFKTGYSQLYNLTVQQELTPTLSLEVAYVGSLSRKLPYAVGDINKGDRISSALGHINAQFAIGTGNYHSLQSKLTKRFSRGVSFQASYTYGKSLDNGPAPFNLGKNHNQPQNPFNLGPEYAVSDNDVKHNLAFNAVYELPFGKGRQYFGNLSGVKQAIFGGWQMNTIFYARTGTPVNVIQNGLSTTDPGLRPNLLRDPNLDRGDRTLNHYFDTAAFCVPPDAGCPALGPNGEGSAPRNPLRGPGYVNVDYSAFKEFQPTDRLKLQMRFELFNLFNTPHFANPAGDLNQQGSFGRIQNTGANASRVVQFAAKFLF